MSLQEIGDQVSPLRYTYLKVNSSCRLPWLQKITQEPNTKFIIRTTVFGWFIYRYKAVVLWSKTPVAINIGDKFKIVWSLAKGLWIEQSKLKISKASAMFIQFHNTSHTPHASLTFIGPGQHAVFHYSILIITSRLLAMIYQQASQVSCFLPQPGPRFSIKMSPYQFLKSHCGDKTVGISSLLHNGISDNG